MALKQANGPLHGLEVQFQHHAYDWNDTAPLARLLAGPAARGVMIAVSSEGGLFEYGSPRSRADRGRFGHELERGARAADDHADEIPVFPRGLDGFAPLAE
jgi:hypothetical protein